MSIFLRPKIRLKWGYWRSLEVNCTNFVAKVKFGNSFRYNILSSLKSEVALRSLKAAWGDVWEFFSRLIVQIFCMACSLHAISLMSIILRPRSVQMLRSLEVTSDHLLLHPSHRSKKTSTFLPIWSVWSCWNALITGNSMESTPKSFDKNNS